ncbi:hypothetical protein [Microcoleus sp.]|uniref:hypothetical protein n=1 Tax=Microcoleus sp. TaxID=44472 RepID=UPI00352524D5
MGGIKTRLYISRIFFRCQVRSTTMSEGWEKSIAIPANIDTMMYSGYCSIAHL